MPKLNTVVIWEKENSGIKDKLSPILKELGEKDFTLIKWEKAEDVIKKLPEGDFPLLIFVEKNRDGLSAENFDFLLKKLSSDKRAQVYVISTKESFLSQEAAEVWLNSEYATVINYTLLKHLKENDVKKAIEKMKKLAKTWEEKSVKTHLIGKWLSIPSGEYNQSKFVSLFLGGTQEIIVQVRHFIRELERILPVPKKEHLFKKKSPQALFDGAVKKMFEENQEAPKWLEKLLEEGENRSYAVPHLLIEGETGTGKTLLAQFLHRLRWNYWDRDKKEQELVDRILQDLNCRAIPENLINGELFGANAGSWTGLNRNLPGRIFCACHGTLILDEIGDMPEYTQSLLLKFLDDGNYTPLGWDRKLYIPVAIIAATNQSIEQLIEEGKFRDDLYKRFRFRVRLPSLSERMEHFEELVDFVLQNPAINPFIEEESSTKVSHISEDALNLLRGYDYPGNFRELEQILWHAVLKAEEEGKDVLLSRHISLPSHSK